MIRESIKLQALVLVAAGSLLGYAAATAVRSRTAVAATPATDPDPSSCGSEGEASCCSIDPPLRPL